MGSNLKMYNNMPRPTNNSPVVNWSLDQKESIKSAFFIGYVIMQVKLYFL